ncbi:FAD-dependent monooxygenase [Streptomyces sp. NPDC087856]|uniref:FAD-dependent monooxygenase n=1 Tax=Streptomyces sp. NPDC087856 TaxID=3365811 RepID=UPI00380AB52D
MTESVKPLSGVADREVDTLVVGGGIGGLASALAIVRTGRSVHVVEQAPAFSEIGAGLQIGPNASAAMQRLGVLKHVAAEAVTPRTAVMRDAVTGTEITSLDLGPAFRDRYRFPYLVVHRNDVLGALLDACRQEPLLTLETGRQARSVHASGSGTVVAFADGSTIGAQLVVGADGLRSVIRKTIADDEPVYSGYTAFRGTVPTSAVRSDVPMDDVVLWIGAGMHLMQYPVRNKQVYNQVAVVRRPVSEDGPPAPGFLAETFAGAHPAVLQSVSLIATERDWPLFDRDPIDRWVRDGVVLVGDAAHPMLQYLGQGAGQALEDAVVLADCLERSADRDTALASYEAKRVTRGTRCQRSARPWGELWHTDDPLVLALRRRVLGGQDPSDYSELDWLYASQV